MTPAEYIQGFRDLADWLETNQEALADDIPYHAGNDYPLGTMIVQGYTAEEFAAKVRLLGRGVKKPTEAHMNVVRQFGPIAVEVYTARETVCRKVVTGTKTVTETVPDPEKKAAALTLVPLIKVTREVDVVEWVCDDPILAHIPEAEAVVS